MIRKLSLEYLKDCLWSSVSLKSDHLIRLENYSARLIRITGIILFSRRSERLAAPTASFVSGSRRVDFWQRSLLDCRVEKNQGAR